MAIDDLRTKPESEKAPWQTCQVCHYLSGLPADRAEIIRGALGDSAWRFTTIRDEIATDKAHPAELDAQSLRRHANGQCAAREKLRKVARS